MVGPTQCNANRNVTLMILDTIQIPQRFLEFYRNLWKNEINWI